VVPHTHKVVHKHITDTHTSHITFNHKKRRSHKMY